MSTYINLNNGSGRNYDSDDVLRLSHPAHWLETQMVEQQLDQRIVEAMDDEIREQVHGELAPCTPREFLARYLELATEPLVIG